MEGERSEADEAWTARVKRAKGKEKERPRGGREWAAKEERWRHNGICPVDAYLVKCNIPLFQNV